MPLHSDIKLGSSQVLRAYSGANLFWEWTGGSGGTIPTSGLDAWYDASVGLYDATSGGSAVTTNGAAIARWEDQSGNGNHLTQSVINSQSTLKTNGQGGKNGVNFDGGDYFDITNPIPTNADFSTFIVMSKNAADPSGTFSFGLGGSNIQSLHIWHHPSWAASSPSRPSIIDNAGRLYAGALDASSKVILLSGTRNFTTNALSLQVDGNAQTISFYNSVSNTPSTLSYVGRRSSNYQLGDIYEIITYDRVLSASEIQQVENYLMTKYGL